MKHASIYREHLSSFPFAVLSAVVLGALVTGGCTGTAATGGGGSSCSSSADCDPGWICDAVTHGCFQLCVQDSECPSDYSCTDGTCQPVPDAVCHSPGECSSPPICGDANQPFCVGGHCKYGFMPMGTTCTNLCVDGAAACDVAGKCTGTPKACADPPDTKCEDNNSTCVTYAQVGTCNGATGDCVYTETRTATTPTNCVHECIDACAGIDCSDTSGGCKSNGHCVPTPPNADCAYDLAGDDTPCATPDDVGGTKSGHCLAGECVECTVAAHEVENCALCKGERSRDCVDGKWSDWSVCSNDNYPGVCTPGTVDVTGGACGNCSTGTNKRTCGIDCLWPINWTCEGGGACVPGTTDASGGACGVGGTNTKTCTGTCTWPTSWTCSGGGTCTSGDVDATGGPCGNCGTGTNKKTCLANGTWPVSWTCEGGGICVAGTVDATGGACGNCSTGTNKKTCLANCTWPTSWSCEGGGTCAPGTVDATGGACGNCSTGTNKKTCTGTCTWPSSWTCEGGGACATGTVDATGGSCGNCGTGTNKKTCTGTCTWPGSWTCEGGGVCATGTVDATGGSCGNCGTGTNKKTCTGTCTWPSSWTCEGGGACSPPETMTRNPCGNCSLGTETKACTVGCAWPADWTCVGGGACVGGTVDTTGGPCGDCGTLERTCSTSTCAWSDWGCVGTGSCDSDGNDCTDDNCSVTGVCHVALTNFTSCSDYGCIPSGGYCWNVTCVGTEMTSPVDTDYDLCHTNHRCTSTYGYPECTYDYTYTTEQCHALRVAAEHWDNPCEYDYCKSTTGSCAMAYHTYGPSGYICDPETNCKYATRCASNGYCQYGGGSKCDDSDYCTTDSCDPGTGACSHYFQPGNGCCDSCSDSGCEGYTCMTDGQCAGIGCCWIGGTCYGSGCGSGC